MVVPGVAATRRWVVGLSFGRRLIAAAVAFLLGATMAVPLLAEARHEASAAHVAHAVVSVVEHDHGAGQQGSDDLVHHAQAHAQAVMPTLTKTPAGAVSVTMAFGALDELGRAGARDPGPFEPPRA